jgi:hypothetical protein
MLIIQIVTFFDTCMVSLAALIVWRFPPYVVFLPWLTIACLDGVYISSALTKVPDGAWFTITLASVLASILILWRFGKEQQWAAEAEDRFPTTHLVQKGEGGWIKLTSRYGGDDLSVIKGANSFRRSISSFECLACHLLPRHTFGSRQLLKHWLNSNLLYLAALTLRFCHFRIWDIFRQGRGNYTGRFHSVFEQTCGSSRGKYSYMFHFRFNLLF